jgi:hypothetical protein
MRRLPSLETPKIKYLAQRHPTPEEMNRRYGNSFVDETERTGKRWILIPHEGKILQYMK